MNVEGILQLVEKIAPSRFAMPDDPIGLQIGSPSDSVARAVVSLDSSIDAIRFAKDSKADLLIAHHPLIFLPITEISASRRPGPEIAELIRSGIAFLSAHTNWDAAPDGISDTLAARIGLADVTPFGEGSRTRMVKLEVYVPGDSLQGLVDSLAKAGAGQIGEYERCAYWTEGQGTFKPLTEANPTIGEVGSIEIVGESKLEMVLRPELTETVRKALLAAHPYEEPAYSSVETVPWTECPLGRVGDLTMPLDAVQLKNQVEESLRTSCLLWQPNASTSIRRVAVCGGAGAFLWSDALAHGADAFVTGEIPQHLALEASQSGLVMVQAGHYATEQPGCETLAEKLRGSAPDVEFLLFEPEQGKSGRPLH